ncbi:hypothetical protein [Mangrovicoccus ximenensis]|uniref:hypothetical protein n=1 Tax=Mangrovicoccus ximenensis TaxID=1911570 RepID=UPI0011AE6099|nr:hypothetical protein [Mangrovicoccus ximenensis]
MKDKFMNSFKETRQGTILQKYKLKVVTADEVGSSSLQNNLSTASPKIPILMYGTQQAQQSSHSDRN